MKKNAYIITVLSIGILFLIGCNDYLDELPDNRTEVNTPEKVTKILLSAYSKTLPILFHEAMSDNMTDRGRSYDWGLDILRDAYCFSYPLTADGTSSPSSIWSSNYKAISAANEALKAIESMEADYDLSAQKGEALICRAYAHFTLCNAFCQAYNPKTSSTDLGIPYCYKVETTAFNTYERETVAAVYAKIAQDIEEGLPLIDDNLYTQPKYHFNKVAANAFAAQFYLFYGDYEKSVKYANAALGNNPAQKLRNLDAWNAHSGASEMTAYWVSSENSCNVFIQALSSLAGRMFYYRPAHIYPLLSETVRSSGPWGDYLKYGESLYVNRNSSYISPKQSEYFVYTDVTQGIGHTHIVNVVYSTEKVLINRAEAYIMMGEYDKAAKDLSLVYTGGGGNAASASELIDYYTKASNLHKKTIAPRFIVAEGDQENMIHACLHIRRVITLHEGTRMLDIKRFGIAYTHELDNETNIEIEPYDKRLAIPIPTLVAAAGMEQNPR